MTSYLRRISPTMAVAVLALVMAFSSSATAALMISGKQIKDHSITGKDLKKNAVKSKTIKNRSVKGKDLKKGAVKSSHVADHTLTGSDIKNGSITSESISSTLLQTINNGASGFQVVTAQSTGPAPLGARREVSASCPAGKVAISANSYTESPVETLPATQIQRTGNNGFTASDVNDIALLGAGPLVLQVTCVSAG